MEKDHPKNYWRVCVERRIGKGGMCASIQDDGFSEYCISFDPLDQGIIPIALTGHDLGMVFDPERLTSISRLRQGEDSHLVNGTNEPLLFVRNIPLPVSQLPDTPAVQQRKVEANRNLSSKLAQLTHTEWLKGVPRELIPNIQSWLVSTKRYRNPNSGRMVTTTNLIDTKAKVEVARCKHWGPVAAAAFEAKGVPKIAALAMIEESRCNPNQGINEEGAGGLCQFTAASARAYGMRVDKDHDDRMDPDICIPKAAQYVKDHIDKMESLGCKGTPLLKGIMAYNSGLTHFVNWGYCPKSDKQALALRGQTGEYLNRILAMGYLLDTGTAKLGEPPPPPPRPAPRTLAKTKTRRQVSIYIAPAATADRDTAAD